MINTLTSPNICNVHILDIISNGVRVKLETLKPSTRSNPYSINEWCRQGLIIDGLERNVQEGSRHSMLSIKKLGTPMIFLSLKFFNAIRETIIKPSLNFIFHLLAQQVARRKYRKHVDTSIKKLGTPMIFLSLKFFNAIRETIIKPSLNFIFHLLAQQVARRKYRKHVDTSIKKLRNSIKIWKYLYERT